MSFLPGFELEPIAPPVVSGNPRQKQIDAVLKKARDAWKARYELFILDFAALADEPFTAEDVREIYLRMPGLPHTDKEQASGGIFQRLAKQGKLLHAGTKRSRKFGNLLQAYTRGKG